MRQILFVIILLLIPLFTANGQDIENLCDPDLLTTTEYSECQKIEKYNKCYDECKGTQNEDSFCNCKCEGGVTLNTNIPFVGRCILLGDQSNRQEGTTQVTQMTAFPVLIRALMNIVLSIILISSLIMIIVGGIMIASGGADSNNYEAGKTLIRKVIIGLIFLGASGILLAIINPNFFG